MKVRRNNAFTVVELVVVIAVIGILATITAVGYTKLQRDTRDTERASDMAIVQSTLETFYEKNGSYPHMEFFYYGSSSHGNKKFTQYVSLPSAAMTDPADPSPSEPLYSYPSEATWVADPTAATSWLTSTAHRYVYVSYTSASGLCQYSAGCTRYVLRYFKEEDGTAKEIRSRYGW